MPSLKRKASDDDLLVGGPERDDFPTKIFLDGDEIEALGISGLKLGDEKTLMAKVKVTSTSANETEGDEKVRRSMTLTFLEAEVEGSTDSEAARAERLFGDN